MKPEIKQRIEQIRRGEIPAGYKKTKAGIVPLEWKESRFKFLFNRINRKNNEGNTNVLTISAQHGLINQEDFFHKTIASDDKSNYFLLYRGDFAYNKSYSSGYPFGALKRLDRYDKGIVSPLYICFSANKENKCPDFYLHYFESGKLNSEIQAVAQEGARNHGLLNISIDDFFNSVILVPPLHEQQRIVEILSTQDKVIELYEKKIEQLQLLKKICMTKMFPKEGSLVPEVRFPEFTAPWEQRKLGEVSDLRGRIGFRGYKRTDIVAVHEGAISFSPSDIDDDGHVSLHDNCYISYNKYEESPEIKVKIGDILFTKTASIGKIGYISVLHELATINPQIALITPKQNIEGYFLFLVLRSSAFMGKVLGISGGSSILTLSQEKLKELFFVVPHGREQQKIKDLFLYFDNLITLNKRRLDEEKRKKKALMQLLLTGIVRV